MTSEKKTCNCKEMSCKKTCQRKHTHKGFFCEICEPVASSQMTSEKKDLAELLEEFENLPLNIGSITETGRPANETSINRIRNFITHTFEIGKEIGREERCGKEMSDGSICGVKLDCHLHDWRQKDLLIQARHSLISEILSKLEREEVNAMSNYNNPEAYARDIGHNTALEKAISIIRNYEGKE